ncbi:MAG: hypothetical protein N2689_06955 [Verrucomicrobiae bacterium]|nr:hypothetical protein [Verrucomicrobiae bacterium]
MRVGEHLDLCELLLECLAGARDQVRLALRLHQFVFEHDQAAVERLDHLRPAALELVMPPPQLLQLAPRPLQFVLLALQHLNPLARLLQ